MHPLCMRPIRPILPHVLRFCSALQSVLASPLRVSAAAVHPQQRTDSGRCKFALEMACQSTCGLRTGQRLSRGPSLTRTMSERRVQVRMMRLAAACQDHRTTARVVLPARRASAVKVLPRFRMPGPCRAAERRHSRVPMECGSRQARVMHSTRLDAES